jgi:hypothetical protein
MSSTPSASTLSERDVQVVAAMRRAIRSMELVDGLTIHFHDMTGHLSFGHDIETLNQAIVLMGADPGSPFGEPQVETPGGHRDHIRAPDAPLPGPRGPIWARWLGRLVRS